MLRRIDEAAATTTTKGTCKIVTWDFSMHRVHALD